MLPDSTTVSASKLAHEFFGLLDARGSNLEASDRCRLAQHDIDERRFREEIFYLRAFAVYYATCVALRDSRQGSALRAAFMGIWDKAARTSPEKMRSYNEFFRRISFYAEAIAAEGSTRAGQLTDRISGKFADLLGAGKNPPLLAIIKAHASNCFGTTSKVVADLLEEKTFAV